MFDFIKDAASGVGDYITDPTGQGAYRRGLSKKEAAQRKLEEDARGRVDVLGQQYTDTAGELSKGYDFLAGRAPGDVARMGELSGQALPTYGGTQYDKTIQDFLDPSMDYQIAEASKGIQAGAAAQGGLLSGKAQKALADRSQQIAGMEYGKAYDRMVGDRDYMTAEEKAKIASQVGASQDLYGRSKDMTGMSLQGLGTQTDLSKWGTTGDVSTRLGTYGNIGGTTAGEGDMRKAGMHAGFTRQIKDLGADALGGFLGGI